MTIVKSQGSNGDCYAYACTGVVEGLLHHLYGANIGINLNEDTLALTAGSGCTIDGGGPDCGFSRIQGGIPCKTGINSFPNYEHAKYFISSYSVQSNTNIANIKAALQYSPVYSSMDVYHDFQHYNYRNGPYCHVYGAYEGRHAVVIVGYNDAEQY
jgi:C1A family cysteine protease